MSLSPRVLGSLKVFRHIHETPAIGTRFIDKSAQLSSILASADMTRDLARLVAHRGVVFFENQDITIDQQKVLVEHMGALTGRPDTSSLHKHPISETTSELGGDISVISSLGGIARGGVADNTLASSGWHTDISFEKVPADFSILKMHTLPPIGGDTLWASTYGAYNKLSPHYRSFLHGLTAMHSAPFFEQMARDLGIKIQDLRGSPYNTGSSLSAIQTHPLTGLNALFVNKSFTTRIMELHPQESESVLDYLARHISENHDLQVRFRWGLNDVAIWDNRSTQHTATNDYSAARQGNRVVGVGDRLFFDPSASTRTGSTDSVEL
ncbi:taurine catabolism dioxygenase [Fistulina hepatica ATCC 64428]|uniref:Taurine catabolism dioxygenase n=1 Tax=Fistulina hepatica ATCC 64428 TaxID=1128425 RepID=A0A0D7AMG2_9AGAR|nr:taurine catabolism dioxygenase [Fistulina hepatica ATCC 64428]